MAQSDSDSCNFPSERRFFSKRFAYFELASTYVHSKFYKIITVSNTISNIESKIAPLTLSSFAL